MRVKNLFVFMSIFVLSFCGVPKDEHQRVQDDLTRVKSENVKLKSDISKLKKEIDEIKFGSERLLKIANSQYSQKKYSDAKSNLEKLIKRHPASDEAKEGKVLLSKVSSIIERRKREKELAEKRRLDNALRKMRKKYDKIEGITWYSDRTSPRYLNFNNIQIYIGKRDSGYTWLVLRIQYTASDWLFIEKYKIHADGKNFEINPPQFNGVKTDHSGGKIWEWYEITKIKDYIPMLKAVAKAKSATIRHIGKDYWRDRAISIAEKRAIRNVFDAFEVLGGKL
jgi:hypothetical protein